MSMPRIVSRNEWLKARLAHLEAEKALTRARDRLYEERRALPWVRIDKSYVFQSPAGPVTLGDLFDGRSQLVVQHFMLSPGKDHICEGCAFMADHVDAARMHFENADLSFAAVSRATMPEIETAKARMGWQFEWVSSNDNDFNYDFGVSFTPQQVAAGEHLYNYGSADFLLEDLHGLSVFARDDAGTIYHTYSTYGRGAEQAIGAFSFLDMVPKGRNETTIMNWVRLHDEYERPPHQSEHCCGAAAAAE